MDEGGVSLLAGMMPSYWCICFEGLRLGVRAEGHRRKKGCFDGQLLERIAQSCPKPGRSPRLSFCTPRMFGS